MGTGNRLARGTRGARTFAGALCEGYVLGHTMHSEQVLPKVRCIPPGGLNHGFGAACNHTMALFFQLHVTRFPPKKYQAQDANWPFEFLAGTTHGSLRSSAGAAGGLGTAAGADDAGDEADPDPDATTGCAGAGDEADPDSDATSGAGPVAVLTLRVKVFFGGRGPGSAGSLVDSPRLRLAAMMGCEKGRYGQGQVWAANTHSERQFASVHPSETKA